MLWVGNFVLNLIWFWPVYVLFEFPALLVFEVVVQILGRFWCYWKCNHAYKEWYKAEVETAHSDEVVFEDFLHSFPNISMVRIVKILDTNDKETSYA